MQYNHEKSESEKQVDTWKWDPGLDRLQNVKNLVKSCPGLRLSFCVRVVMNEGKTAHHSDHHSEQIASKRTREKSNVHI
jgi:hypothetical protein